MRGLRWTMLVGAMALAVTSAYGTGSISTTDATIESGTAPSRGSVTIDPCAPPGTSPEFPIIPAVDIGSQVVTALSAPDLGSEGDGSFLASSNQGLSGGTYEYDDFDITSGATVTYSGPVTIRVTGRARINGTVRTTAANAHITIHCDRLELIGGDPQSTDHRIHAEGSGSDVEVVAVTHASIGALGGPFARCRIASEDGDILLGVTTAADTSSMSIQHTDIGGSGGSIRCVSSGVLFMSDSNIDGEGSVELFAGTAAENGTSLSLFDHAFVLGGADRDVLVEAAEGNVSIVRSSIVRADGGLCTVRAQQGRIELSDGCSAVTTSDGSVEVAASDGVTIGKNSSVTSEAGGTTLRSSGGAILVVDDSGAASVASTGGDVLCESGGSFAFEVTGASTVTAQGDVTVRATDGEIFAAGLDAPMGTVRIDGAGSVSCGGTISGNHVIVNADGNADVTGTIESDGATTVSCTFRMVVSGGIVSGGPIALSARDRITLDGATVTTADALGVPSAPIVIHSYQAFAAISADGATVRSGNSDVASGDVSIRVLGGGTAGPAALDGFIAPKSIRARIKNSKPEKSSLSLSGTLDSGTTGPLVAGPCRFEVGSASVDGTLVAKGRKLQLVTDEASIKIVPSRDGGSRAKLKVKVTGSLVANVQADGELALRLTQGDVDASADVALDGRRFRLGRNPGALATPDVFPVSCKAGVRGNGRDTLSLRVGFASTGVTPGTAPDLTVGFGDSFSVTIPGDELSGPSRDRFSARRPDSAESVSKATLDYRKELLTISIRDVDLGAFPSSDTVPVTLTLGLGSDERAVDIVLVRRGSGLVY